MANLKSVNATLQSEITERRRAEELLRLQATALEAAANAIVITDREGRIIWVNPAFTRLTGYRFEEVLGQNPRFLKSGNHDRSLYQNLWETLLAGRVWRGEMINRRKDGRLYTEEETITPVRDDGGTITHFIAIKQDVSESKRVEEALRQSEERYRTVGETIPYGVWVADPVGYCSYVSDSFLELVGMTMEQVQQFGWLHLLPPEDVEPTKEHWLHCVQIGEHFEREHRIRTKDGSYRHVLAIGRPVRGEQGQITSWVGINLDISDRIRLKLERIELEAQLRQKQKLEAIGTLASGVAHEINNPITGIMNYAQLIGDAAPAGSRAAEYAGEIVHETERVATVMRNLLQFARQEKQSHSPARLTDIVEQTLSLLRAVLRRDQITLTVDVPEDLPSIKCRSQQIQQVLMNLLINAQDALNEKYPGYHADKTIQVCVRPFEQDGRRWLRLTVADRGNGIPVEIQNRIFDPFFTTKPRDKRTGLDLSISHGIVQDHHGVLHFETEPGQGTRFHLDLPVEQEE